MGKWFKILNLLSKLTDFEGLLQFLHLHRGLGREVPLYITALNHDISQKIYSSEHNIKRGVWETKLLPGKVP